MLWKPDTCKCQIEYNGANSPENFVKIIKTCQAHTGATDLAQILHNENTSKNKALGIIQEKHSELTDQTVDDEGNITVKFKKSKEPTWYFDQDRKIHIVVDVKSEDKVSLKEETDKLSQEVIFD